MRRVEPPPIRPTEEIEAVHHGAWQEWLGKLTPDELVELERLKLVAPAAPGKRKRPRVVIDDDDERSLGIGDYLESEGLDPAEALMAKEEAELAARTGSESARFEIDETTRRDLVLLGYVLPAIIDADDPRLVASTMALALGMAGRMAIMADRVAVRHGVKISVLMAQVREWQRNLDVCRASVFLLRLVLSPILASDNPRLEADTIAMAARFGLNGGASMTARGEYHGVCKAAISARVRRWVKKLGLALPRDCKQATGNYVLFNVRKEKPKAIEK